MPSSFRSGQSIFLNLPFDPKYRPMLVAFVAGLTAFGGKPRCVLELPGAGRSRLDRIYDLIASCSVSIHDLSRVGLSGAFRVPRFNMPFELGMAYALTRHQSHNFFIFEEKTHRLQASLSDLNGHDPHIHGGTQEGVLRCLLDCFGKSGRAPSFSMLLSITARLGRAVLRIQREHRVEDPFHPFMFRHLVQAAAELARDEGLIR